MRVWTERPLPPSRPRTAAVGRRAAREHRALLVQETLVGDAWQLVIEDNAGGIPEALRPHIFEPFFTGHEDDSHAGLGLTVSLELVTRLGGTLEVEHIHSGTRVCVELPVARSVDPSN